MPEIDPDRLLSDLRTLARFGAYKTGVHRPTYSPQDMEARRWLVGRMEAAGLDTTMDGIGNILGRAPGRRRRLLVGSHAESQNHAGWLDGALGVIYGIEIARTFRDDPAIAVDPVVWADEEAHFGFFLGSRSGIGRVTDAEIAATRNRKTGQGLPDALAEAGLAGRPRLTIDPAAYRGYIEAHIEQGDVLDTSGLAIGTVTSIVGIYQYRITFRGVQNHAGTTRMAIRRDAGAALIDLAHRADARLRELAAERTVWTVGRITLDPGETSIIPGGAELMLQVRDADPAVLARLDAGLRDLVAEADARGPCAVAIELIQRSEPHLMAETFQAALDRAAEAHAPGRHIRMPSGAGHDAQILATVMPSAMLFVPSIGGISHHWDENTADEDIVLGARVLASACEAILRHPEAPAHTAL